MNDYRTRFLLAFVGNIALVAILVGVWWHYRAPEPAVKAQQKDMAASGVQDSAEGPMPAAPKAQAAPETPMAPVPMSKQQLQSIGLEPPRSNAKRLRMKS